MRAKYFPLCNAERPRPRDLQLPSFIASREGGGTPLHAACANGWAPLAVDLMADFGADPRAARADGATPLHAALEWASAAQRPTHGLASLLTPASAARCCPPARAPLAGSGKTPLHVAARLGLVEAARLLAPLADFADDGTSPPRRRRCRLDRRLGSRGNAAAGRPGRRPGRQAPTEPPAAAVTRHRGG